MKVTVVCKKSERRIIYLESNKDFVDVLMSFLLLPIGSSMRLVHGDAKAGVAKVFSSVKQMDDAIMQGDKKLLVDPKPPEGFMEILLGVDSTQDSTTATPPPFKPSEHAFYRCSSGRLCPEISMDDNTRRCNACGYMLSIPVQVVAPPQTGTHQPLLPPRRVTSRGFVKENVSFMVTDDLQIFPVSVAKSFTLLSAYKVESFSDVETVELDVGPAEVLHLLKTSLTSMTVLNDVFQSRLPKLPVPTPAPAIPTSRIRYP